MSSWSDYITEDDLQSFVDSTNNEVGPGRYVTIDQLKAVVASALERYDYLPESEKANALLWDASQFAKYSAGLEDQDEDTSRYVSLLASGHPDALEPDTLAAAAWIADAPELDPSQRAVIATALSPNSDYLRLVHATSRMKAIIASGRVSEKTAQNIESYTARLLNIPTALL